MDKNWVLAYSTNKIYEADMLKEFLEDNDIDAFILNKQDTSYLIGDVEIYTKPDDLIRAKLLIEKFGL